MDLSIFWFLIIGLVAGYLANVIMKGRGMGLVGNLLVGVVGAIIGGFLLKILGIPSVNLLGSLLTALAGAIILLFLIGLVKRS